MSLTSEQQSEIDAQRAQSAPTRRTVAPGLEDQLYKAIPLLDHGFVRAIDYMGDDEAIVQAARVSYGKGTKTARNEAGLIRYLMRHWHSTPFEMCEIKLHVKLPIFIARQWIRHRTANVNEYSARYSILDKEYYVPAPEQLASQATSNRQGRGEVLEGEDAQRVLDMLRADAELTYGHYEEMLNEDADEQPLDPSRPGLARELARMNLTLGTYTQWYWKIDLHNLFHFIRLRADPHAQYEIRVYADAIGELVKAWVPIAYGAFEDYRLNAAQMSGPAMVALKRMLAGETVEQPDSGMSPGEWREFVDTIGR